MVSKCSSCDEKMNEIWPGYEIMMVRRSNNGLGAISFNIFFYLDKGPDKVL